MKAGEPKYLQDVLDPKPPATIETTETLQPPGQPTDWGIDPYGQIRPKVPDDQASWQSTAIHVMLGILILGMYLFSL